MDTCCIQMHLALYYAVFRRFLLIFSWRNPCPLVSELFYCQKSHVTRALPLAFELYKSSSALVSACITLSRGQCLVTPILTVTSLSWRTSFFILLSVSFLLLRLRLLLRRWLLLQSDGTAWTLRLLLQKDREYLSACSGLL